MNAALHKKLRITGGLSIGVIGPEQEILHELLPLPSKCEVSISASSSNDRLFLFVRTQSELKKHWPEAMRLLTDKNLLWIGYPKGSSKMQTDLTRDKGWDIIHASGEFAFVSFISFNDVWSTFALRKKNAYDLKQETKTAPRAIFEYADSATKTIRLPEDLEAAFNKNPIAGDQFYALSFSHKREYIEWIITAKKPETRQARITGTMDKLMMGFKNPADKKTR